MRMQLLSGLILCGCLAGCGRERTVKTTETIEGPGGTTTVTVERTVESTGENPPVSSEGDRVLPHNADPNVPNDGLNAPLNP